VATIERYYTANGAMLYSVRYRTPQHRQTRRRGFATKREAQLFAASVEVAKAKGEFIPTSAGRMTIGALGPPWLERQRGHLKPSAFWSLDSAWRVHVAPRWGGVRIGDVRFSDVQAWLSELAATRRSTVVNTAHSVLRRILDDCVRDRLLAANPALGVKLPARPPRKNVYLSAAQLEALADESGRYGSLVLLLGVGGLRWGEAAALRVRDIDFLRRRITLHTNAVKVGGTIVVGSLKSNKNRTVALPGFVIDALAQTCAGKARDELLWPSRSGSYLGPPSSHESWLSGAGQRCQQTDKTFPRITAHGLRHTAASLAIHAGANPKVVQRMLGHASAAMTLDVYADLFDSDLDTVAVTVSKMWPRQAN
jgi:integrase